MDVYVCPNCEVSFQEAKLFADHKEMGYEWASDGDSYPRYCCGMIYEHGETSCLSCGEPL